MQVSGLDEVSKILNNLSGLSTEYNVRVLFAVEAGSRSTGLESPESDFDVKFVYAHPPKWYLCIDEGRREVIDKFCENDRMDFHGWDIRKAMKMLRESNCSILEWLYSPIVYFDNDGFLDAARQIASQSISWKAVAFNYLNKARKHLREFFEGDQWEKEVYLKKYFYVVGPLLSVEWMRQTRLQKMPPQMFWELMAQVKIPQEVVHEINVLVEAKKGSTSTTEQKKAPRMEKLDKWIEATVVDCNTFAAKELQIAKLPPTDPFNEIVQHVVLGKNSDNKGNNSILSTTVTRNTTSNITTTETL